MTSGTSSPAQLPAQRYHSAFKGSPQQNPRQALQAFDDSIESLMEDVQNFIRFNNAAKLARSLVSYSANMEPQDENSYRNIERIQIIIFRGLRSLQDPISLAINTLISISSIGETTRLDKDVELAVTQYFVGALKRFCAWSQSPTRGNDLLDDEHVVVNLDPLLPSQLPLSASSTQSRQGTFLSETDKAMTTGYVTSNDDTDDLIDYIGKEAQRRPSPPVATVGTVSMSPRTSQFQGQMKFTTTTSSTSLEPIKASDTPHDTEVIGSSSRVPTTIGTGTELYPLEPSHKNTILREIAFRRSIFQVYALLDVFDMSEMLNDRIQSHFSGQGGLESSSVVGAVNDETFGSRLALQLMYVGQVTEAILLITRILKGRSKELDDKVIPYLIELEDHGLVNEFVRNYHDVCQSVLEAIDNRLCIQLGDMEQARDPKVRVRLAEIAMGLIMRLDFENELNKLFPSIKFVVNYNTIMALLDESLTNWMDMAQNQWRFLPAVEAMIKDDPKLQKMVIVYCLCQGTMVHHKSYERAAKYLARNLGLEKELDKWRPDAPQVEDSDKPPVDTKRHLEPHIPFDMDDHPSFRDTHSERIPDVKADGSIPASDTPSKSQTFTCIPSAPSSPSRSTPSSSATNEPLPVWSAPEKPAIAPALSAEAPSTDKTNSSLPPPDAAPFYPVPLYILPPSTKVILVDQLNQLDRLDKALYHSKAVAVTSTLIDDTRRPSPQFILDLITSKATQAKSQSSSQQQSTKPSSQPITFTTLQQKSSGMPFETHKVTALLQLACDSSDSVFVIDMAAFRGDRGARLTRIIGGFFANRATKKIGFNWAPERTVLYDSLPGLRKFQLTNLLDLADVWIRFFPPPRSSSEGISSKCATAETVSQILTGNRQLPGSGPNGSPTGTGSSWVRYTIEFWTTRPWSQGVQMIALGYGGHTTALRKICSKQLPPIPTTGWANRPLTDDQVRQAAVTPHSLLSIYKVLSSRPLKE
ncbi:MAG: hypothetical protein J3Q66DRAFT_338797 [Benniella sp.]|nr:MAG: hypothetical protein J3Q66DRAFT_338797 [Benniella sp.]